MVRIRKELITTPIFKIKRKKAKEFIVKDTKRKGIREILVKNKSNPTKDYYKYFFTDEVVLSYTSKGKALIHENLGLLKELYKTLSKNTFYNIVHLKKGGKLKIESFEPGFGSSHEILFKISLDNQGKKPTTIFLKQNSFDFEMHEANIKSNYPYKARMDPLQPHREIFAMNYLEKLGFSVIKPLFGIADEKHKLNYTAYPFVEKMKVVADEFEHLDDFSMKKLKGIRKYIESKDIIGFDLDDMFCKKIGTKNGRPIYKFYIFDNYFDYDRRRKSSIQDAMVNVMKAKNRSR